LQSYYIDRRSALSTEEELNRYNTDHMQQHLDPWHWGAAFVGAFLVGISKTGFSGAGILVVAIFAQIMPARASTGVVLPLLISGDVIAVAAFRRHAVWSHVIRMLPWSMTGVVLGYFAMSHINDAGTKKLIGLTLIVMTTIQIVKKIRERGGAATSDSTGPGGKAHVLYVASMGLLAGFTTMTANAAGPIMILYLLAMGLPKMEFVGTGAWYFLIVNVFKVPFSMGQGLINVHSILFDLKLVPACIVGALLGRVLVKRINQTAFEFMALAFAVIGAMRLLR